MTARPTSSGYRVMIRRACGSRGGEDQWDSWGWTRNDGKVSAYGYHDIAEALIFTNCTLDFFGTIGGGRRGF